MKTTIATIVIALAAGAVGAYVYGKYKKKKGGCGCKDCQEKATGTTSTTPGTTAIVSEGVVQPAVLLGGAQTDVKADNPLDFTGGNKGWWNP